MKALRIETLDPAYNLALEETLLQALKPSDPGWFLIWRNAPSIIIGRHQNTVEEINEDFVRERGIRVIRRSTGGGAVYHDEGNINYSCITPYTASEAPGFAFFLEPIAGALQDLGIPAELSSRNDITVNGLKVSGSAQRRSGYRLLHHGTMMVDLDTSVLGQALTGNPDKYTSKGVASHKSRVNTLRAMLSPDLSREQSLELVINAMLRRCAHGSATLTAEQERAANALADAKYRTWEWNYGKSPEYTERRRKRFAWGSLECLLNVKSGAIQQCKFYGDFFSLKTVGDLESLFAGLPREPRALRAALAQAPVESWFVGSNRDDLLDFLCDG